MFRALSPAASDGDQVAIKMRAKISMTARAGFCPLHQEQVADAMLVGLFEHLDHSPNCPYRSTAIRMWEQLVDIGLAGAFLHANDSRNHT